MPRKFLVQMLLIVRSAASIFNSCISPGQTLLTSSKSGITDDMTGITNHSKVAPRSDLSQSRVLVIPHLSRDDMNWVSKVNSNIQVMLYHVEEWDAFLHPPRNKGHEALAYLTYLIDHYDTLPDLAVFMHAHRYAHHNNMALGLDAVQIINRLEKGFVDKLGYVNLHCYHTVGCPTWLELHENQAPLGKQEQDILAKCWRELYPRTKLPMNLAQPCCGQFAVSKNQIILLTLERLIYLRDWLLRTSLADYFSGRMWEYLWHFVFLHKNTYCLPTEKCLCEGFSVCA